MFSLCQRNTHPIKLPLDNLVVVQAPKHIFACINSFENLCNKGDMEQYLKD